MLAPLFGALLFYVSILDVCSGAVFLLTTPKEAYYDAKLVVSVAAFGLAPEHKELVTLEYRGRKDTSRVLNSTTLEFTSDTSKAWTVVFPWEKMQHIDESGVMLKMSSGYHSEEKTLSFTNNFGYIFIQTDKPIYTPLQTVKFRVIAVDEYQQLAKYMIKIDIRNEKLIVVDRMRVTADEAFKAKEFELPKDTPPGEWSITANFEGVEQTPSASHTTKFEVREYVLPRFSSTVKVDPDVITRGTKWVTINVTSRYVYGPPVIGTLQLILGIWNSLNSSYTTLPINFTEQLVNGQFEKNVNVGQMFPVDLPFARNDRLYVRATVTENASLESNTVEDTTTFISHPYYLVDFKLSKKYFKPGFPYTLQAQVTAQNGRPASWNDLYVLPSFFNKQDQYIGRNGANHKLNEFGELRKDFDVPPEAVKISFTAIVADFKAPKVENFILNVSKFPSNNNQYIHINITTPIKRNRNGTVLLRYTKPSQTVAGSSYKPDSITVLVLAKGHIIYTTTSTRNLNGHSNVVLPSYLYAEISPNMRIVAYYCVQPGVGGREFVIDSLFVDTPDACLEEIYLSSAGSLNQAFALFKPKDSFVLDVEGTPDMNVGFVAVDKAVLLLNNRQSLNRNLLFTQLGSHDKGVGSADGSSKDEVLENSGLDFVILDTNDPYEHNLGPTASRVEGTLGDIPPQHPKFHPKTTSPQVNLYTVSPPQTVRNYFPESWFFEERRLPESGHLGINLTLPDSITTWSFMAVGISSNRGVCVSHALDQRVMKLFFADVSLPYKATRLEEVKVKISVYNYQTYPMSITVVASSSDGLCFHANSARGSTQNSTSFTLSIPAGQARGNAIKVIPLKIGDLTLRVDLENQNFVKDIVEKKVHVVAEGQRVKKSITFVLDPEGKHASFIPSKNKKKAVYTSTMINNVVDTDTKVQQTTIDLALPSNVIKGTESCRISAFGDLMGDIITHTVIESRSLIDNQLIGANEVLSDLAPTIHALISVNNFRLMDPQLTTHSSKFVKHGIRMLLNYRNDDYGFFLTEKPTSSIWLTAFALKTLCHANLLVFVDKENLINRGFSWLSSQVRTDGSLSEHDIRRANTPSEYDIILSAEVLIAILECNRSVLESHLGLQAEITGYLESQVRTIKDPLVLAKVTYALMLLEPGTEECHEAITRLQSMKRRTMNGQYYWSKIAETDEIKERPYWYHKPPHASAIEATAYALMVFLKHGGINPDAIADWLVGQRNYNGAFIGALDSTAAIQALSTYSLDKHEHNVNLHCNVSSDRHRDHFYLFKFTKENAIHRESLTNVPVGQVIDVLTRGQGLGQMQVNVEYNIPIDKNQNCAFNITVTVTRTTYIESEDMSNQMCTFCNTSCPKPVNTRSSVLSEVIANEATSVMKVKIHNPISKGNRTQTNRKKKTNVNKTNSNKNKNKNKKTKRKPKVDQPKKRQTRALDDDSQASSKKAMCVHVCLQRQRGVSQPTEVRIEMLTGYQPVSADFGGIKNMSNVHNVVYDNIRQVLVVQFTKISCTEKTCVSFRVVDVGEAERLMPANVEVIQIGTALPQCVMEYEGLPNDQSLRVYCADFSHTNKGECRCFSGLCSYCLPEIKSDVKMTFVNKLVCAAPVVYQLQFTNITHMDNWVEISSKVVSLNKTGSDSITSGSIIKMMTPDTCISCPILFYRNTKERFYMLSADVERMVDRNGNSVHRYLLDEKSSFLRVADPDVKQTEKPAVPHYYLQHALSDNNMCNL